MSRNEVSTVNSIQLQEVSDNFDERFNRLEKELKRIEKILEKLLALRNEKPKPSSQEWLTTGQVAKELGLSRYAVSEWCRMGRVNCRKLRSNQWRISREELDRRNDHGLLDNPHKYRHVK